MSKYSVKVYDCAGEFDFADCDTLTDAATLAADFRTKYPHKIVQVFNNDRCDYDTDGLTEDEREAIG